MEPVMRYDPARPISDRRLVTIALGAYVGFAAVYLVIRSGRITGREDSATLWLHARSSAWLDQVMSWISTSGGFWRIVPMSVVVALLLATRRWIASGVFVGAAILAQLSRFGLTRLFPRERPALFTGAQTGDTSFPSGHAYGSTLVYGMIAYGLWRQGHPRLAVIAAVWPILVGISRVDLGDHHPSDVVAAMFLGVAALALAIMAYEHLRARSESRHELRPTGDRHRRATSAA